MLRVNAKKVIILAVLSCFPVTLWATRGPEDFGLMMILVAMFFSFPAGILLVCLIVYTIAWLKNSEKPVAKRGNVVFVISLVIMVLAVIIPLLFMNLGKWHSKIIEVMLGDCVPIVLLSALSAVLSYRLMKRS